jgi:threonine/homoserine/homoserine lactone efflux protein
MTAVLSFAVVGGLLAITPGLDTALVLRSAVSSGRRTALATGLGVCAGALVWGAAAAVGVSALLTTSQVAYPVLRIVGAAYMIWLGGRMLWTAVRGRASVAQVVRRRPLHRCSRRFCGGPDASPREPRILIPGDPLPVRLARSRRRGGDR